MRKKTREEFVKEVYELVGDEYKVLGEYIDSRTKIKMYHITCGNEYSVAPNDFLQGCRCICLTKNHKKTHEIFVKEVYDLVGDEYRVLGEYINNHTKIKMLHTKCGNEFYMTPHSFLSDTRCPCCCPMPKQVTIGINSMYDTNKELAKLLLNPEDGYKYTQGSHKKVDWKCPKCGEIIRQKQIKMVNKNGLSCPICNDGISYPNRLMYSVLSNLHINFETEKSFKWCKYKIENKLCQGRYDYYFIYNNQEYVIEMDGRWHFEDNILSGQTKEESNYIDTEKDRLAREHDIHPIRIDSRESKLEFIKKEIIESDLSNIFEFSSIDWQECERQSTTSLKLQACELWEKYHSTKIISEIMKYCQQTIVNWLKQCSSSGLIDYDSIIECKKSCCLKVVCIETNEIINSMTDASKKYNTSISNISRCCRGKTKSAGQLPDGTKLHWRYAD